MEMNTALVTGLVISALDKVKIGADVSAMTTNKLISALVLRAAIQKLPFDVAKLYTSDKEYRKYFIHKAVELKGWAGLDMSYYVPVLGSVDNKFPPELHKEIDNILSMVTELKKVQGALHNSLTSFLHSCDDLEDAVQALPEIYSLDGINIHNPYVEGVHPEFKELRDTVRLQCGKYTELSAKLKALYDDVEVTFF